MTYEWPTKCKVSARSGARPLTKVWARTGILCLSTVLGLSAGAQPGGGSAGQSISAAARPADHSVLLKNVADSVVSGILGAGRDDILQGGRLCKKAVAVAVAAGIPKTTLIQIDVDMDQLHAQIDDRDFVHIDIQGWASPSQNRRETNWMSLENINNNFCLNYGVTWGWLLKFYPLMRNINDVIHYFENPDETPMDFVQFFSTPDEIKFGSHRQLPLSDPDVADDIREFIETDLAECDAWYRNVLRELPATTKIMIPSVQFKHTAIAGPLTTIADIKIKVCDYARRLATQRLRAFTESAVAEEKKNAARRTAERSREAARYRAYLQVLTGDKQTVFQSEKLLRLLPLRGRGGRKLSTPQDFAESDGWYTCTVSRAKLVSTWSVGGWRFKGDRLDTPHRDTGVGADDCPSQALP